MSEKLKQNQSHEKKISIEAPKEHSEKLRQDLHERAAKHEKQHNKTEELETARNVVEQESITSEKLNISNNEKKPEPVYFTKADRERSFNTTMRHVRSQLNKPGKAFSKVIHQKQVEKASEIVGKTVARPSGIMGAATAALVGISIVLFLAKRTGFQLSGSEFWILLCAGYLLGLFIEAVRKIFRKDDKLA